MPWITAAATNCLPGNWKPWTNAMTPWMASQYNKIIMIDPRSYEGGADGLMKLIEDYEVDDFVISFAGLFMSSGNVGNLLELCK